MISKKIACILNETVVELDDDVICFGEMQKAVVVSDEKEL